MAKTARDRLNNQGRLKLYPVRPATEREKRKYPGLRFFDILSTHFLNEWKQAARKLSAR